MLTTIYVRTCLGALENAGSYSWVFTVLSTWSQKMNSTDNLSAFPHYVYRQKWEFKFWYKGFKS